MLRLCGDFITGSNGPIFIEPTEVNSLAESCDPMPTAIVVIYTAEGFVVGSDGRSNEGFSDCEQKIFPTSNTVWHSAYALSGAVGIGPEQVKSDCHSIAERLEQVQPPNLRTYADLFITALGKRMRLNVVEGLSAQRPSVTTRIDIAGYYSGNPQMAMREIQFTIGSEEVQITRSEDRHPPFPNDPFCVGSPIITNELEHGHDSEFDRFRTEGLKKLVDRKPVSLQEAAEIIRNYIAACATDKARTIDSRCRSIGGHTSIAKITPEGFEWIEPPQLHP